jgi:uncharacterized protein (TIGR00296 family)
VQFKLTEREGEFLVKIARHAVDIYLKEGKTLESPKESPKKLMKHLGVFVTINSVNQREKKLRGCIGFPYPTKPLVKAVIESSINSSVNDPRFQPVSIEELDKVIFEVSVLTAPSLIEVEHPMDLPSQVKVGRDGLIVERGYYKGLLLPQVPTEWNWNEEEFLCQSCVKAGLSPDCWLLKDTKVYRFSCIIAKELYPEGEVVIEDMRK